MGNSFVKLLSKAQKIKRKSFDPEGSGYDDATARSAGLKRDKTGHMGSLDPRTGQVLKGRKHKTWDLMEKEETRRGSRIEKRGTRYYSVK